MRIFILMFMVAYLNGDVLILEFLEKGHYYNQTMIMEENSIEFDVPEHAGINQTQYFYDYEVRMIAMKSANNKKCYVYDMPIDEPSSDDIKAGVLQFDGKFPVNEYMVAEDNILPHRYLANKDVTPKILQFCRGLKIIESVVFNSTKEAEQALKDHLLYETKTSLSRARKSIMRRYDDDYDRLLKRRKVYNEQLRFDERLSLDEKLSFEVELPVNERPMINSDSSQRLPSMDERLLIVSDDASLSIFKSTKKFATCNTEESANEIDLCSKRDKSLKNVDVICEIRDKNCRFKLACKRHSWKLTCKKGEHVYTDVICCDFKCKKDS